MQHNAKFMVDTRPLYSPAKISLPYIIEIVAVLRQFHEFHVCKQLWPCYKNLSLEVDCKAGLQDDYDL